MQGGLLVFYLLSVSSFIIFLVLPHFCFKLIAQSVDLVEEG